MFLWMRTLVPICRQTCGNGLFPHLASHDSFSNCTSDWRRSGAAYALQLQERRKTLYSGKTVWDDEMEVLAHTLHETVCLNRMHICIRIACKSTNHMRLPRCSNRRLCNWKFLDEAIRSRISTITSCCVNFYKVSEASTSHNALTMLTRSIEKGESWLWDVVRSSQL